MKTLAVISEIDLNNADLRKSNEDNKEYIQLFGISLKVFSYLKE